jgi:hypothetical protein
MDGHQKAIIDDHRRVVDTHRLLRHESKMLSVFSNIELRDGLAIKTDIPRQRIVKSLNELDTEQTE